MKYICLGYYEPAKHAVMTEEERSNMFDECFRYDGHLRATGIELVEKLSSPLKRDGLCIGRTAKLRPPTTPYAETKEALGGTMMLTLSTSRQYPFFSVKENCCSMVWTLMRWVFHNRAQDFGVRGPPCARERVEIGLHLMGTKHDEDMRHKREWSKVGGALLPSAAKLKRSGQTGHWKP